MDIHRNPSISTWISIKHGYSFIDIYCLRIFKQGHSAMDTPAWISMRISTLVWIIEDWHPKIMDIYG